MIRLGSAVEQSADMVERFQKRTDQQWASQKAAEGAVYWSDRFLAEDAPMEDPATFKQNFNKWAEEQAKDAPGDLARSAWKEMSADLYLRSSVKNAERYKAGVKESMVLGFDTFASNLIKGYQQGMVTREDVEAGIDSYGQGVTDYVPAQALAPLQGKLQMQLDEAEISQIVEGQNLGDVAEMFSAGKIGEKLTDTGKARLSQELAGRTSVGLAGAEAHLRSLEDRQSRGEAIAPEEMAMAASDVENWREQSAKASTVTVGQKADFAEIILGAGDDEQLAELMRKADAAGMTARQKETALRTVLVTKAANAMEQQTPAEIRAGVDRIKANLPMGDATARAIEAKADQILKLAESDPALFVLRDQALYGQLETAVKSKDAGRIQAAYSVIEQRQRAQGLPVRILTAEEARHIAVGLTAKLSSDPSGALKDIDNMEAYYGPHTGKILGQLANDLPKDARLSPDAAVLAGLPKSAPWRKEVALMMSKEWQDKEGSKTAPFTSSELTKARSKIDGWKNLDRNLISRGMQGNDLAEQYAGLVDRYAGFLARTGQATDAEEAAKMAYDRTLGSLYDVDETGLVVGKVRADGTARAEEDVKDIRGKLDAILSNGILFRSEPESLGSFQYSRRVSNLDQLDTSAMENIIRAEQQPGENLTPDILRERALARMTSTMKWRSDENGNLELRAGTGEGAPVTFAGKRVVVDPGKLEKAERLESVGWFTGNRDRLEEQRQRIGASFESFLADSVTSQPAEDTASFSQATPTGENAMTAEEQILAFEARTKNGKLQVYKLPANDGGGSYEVAGINDKYHPVMAAKLKGLVESGKDGEARKEAAAYIKSYTDGVTKWTGNKGVEAYLRDTAFNRGPGGAAKVLQMAVGVDVDGKVGPKTLAAVRAAEKDPQALLFKLRRAREAYELKVAGRRENFWKGLVSRWDKALVMAKGMA